MDRVVGGTYKLRCMIGSGSFGEVYEASRIGSEELVAVKIEKGATRPSLLMKEATIYTALQGECGIPKILGSGRNQGDNILVLELLGRDLQYLLKLCGEKFTLKTVLMLAIQMIQILERVHSKGFLHRDIKPHNFMMGTGQGRKQVYIIDFGLAKSYLDPVTNCHKPSRKTTSITGSFRYASLNTHLHNGQSRRDDLESLGFVFMHFLEGRLPWHEVSGPNAEQNNDIIADMKRRPEDFCKSLPPEFRSYFNHCRSLEFDQQPDYQILKNLFLDLLGQRGFQNDDIFDWMDLRYQMRRTQPPPINPMFLSFRELVHQLKRVQLPPLIWAVCDVPTNHDTMSSHFKKQMHNSPAIDPVL